VNRIELRLTDDTLVHRRDGLLDVIELYGPDLTIALTVGPAGARAASESGAQLLAATRRQMIPEAEAGHSRGERTNRP
jgi:hypothetical protein